MSKRGWIARQTDGWVATEDHDATHNGEPVRVRAGMDFVYEPGHETMRSAPGKWAPVRASVERSNQGTRQLAHLIESGALNREDLEGLDLDHVRGEVGLESGDGTREPTRAKRSSDPGRDAAMRALESRAKHITQAGGDRAAAVIEADRIGVDRDYITAIADPAYERAFAKLLSQQSNGIPAGLTPAEAEATARVSEALHKQRAMSAGTPGAGGYAVPLTIDPTIMLTSAGTINPMREVATVTEIISSEWQGISSAGITAGFAAEATEASDNSPTLAAPKIKAEKAHAFVPFSIEVGQDWPSLLEELASLVSEAKDVAEATKFMLGDGSDEPEGLIAGLDAGSLVDTTTATTFAVGDVYKVQQALPARFQANASWLTSLAIANLTHRFGGGGGSTDAPLFNGDRSLLLGKPWHETSDMAAVTTDLSKIMLYGDISKAYRIVDRIGMTVELIPHLMGENRRPTGQRGLYAYWRTGGGITVDNAVRILRVKAA